MSDAFEVPAALVDHVIRSCGGGRVLCLGPRAVLLTEAFRRRAVEATGETCADRDPQSRLDLRHDSHSFDIVVVDGLIDGLDATARAQVFAEVIRVARASIVLRDGGGSRLELEREVLGHPCRKHPLHQLLVPYQGLDWEGPVTTLLLEPLPQALSVGAALPDLAGARDLHMDMLREGGRRADAHVARYMLAREFIRPGDRVLDAACGLGYGSAILTDGTLAESVEGIDVDAAAIEYATDHYGRQRTRISFTTADLNALASRPAGCVDAIVSFETLEHISDPTDFLRTCRRLLTPGGRLICSVPNEWLDENGVDPNPYHLQIYNRERLERDCGQEFLIEHVYGQTAGGGMKLTEETRRLWRAEPSEQIAEWWLVVAMTDPATPSASPLRLGLTSTPVPRDTNVLAFDRDYTNPWIVRAMVAIGLRTESGELLASLADQTLNLHESDSADVGAALCVRAYQYLDRGERMPPELVDDITVYVSRPSAVPHVLRWQISLQYMEGLYWLQQGDVRRASMALERCAQADPLVFSPLLATKTVGAAFLLGWMAVQARDLQQASAWWTRGIAHAERALRRPWDELLLDREHPALFGLREATAIVDTASQCASGLALLEHARERPGVVASQLFESFQERLGRTRAAAPSAHTPAPSVEVVEEKAADQPAPTPAPEPETPSWCLLDHLHEATLTCGEPAQLSAWDAEIDGEYSRNVLLHPPAILETTIPTAAAGRLTAKVALHPESWGQAGASGCHFTIAVGGGAQASILLDPHTRLSHRHWFTLTVDVPSAPGASHTLTLETRSLDAPHFGWALFRDVTFVPAVVAPLALTALGREA